MPPEAQKQSSSKNIGPFLIIIGVIIILIIAFSLSKNKPPPQPLAPAEDLSVKDPIFVQNLLQSQSKVAFPTIGSIENTSVSNLPKDLQFITQNSEKIEVKKGIYTNNKKGYLITLHKSNNLLDSYLSFQTFLSSPKSNLTVSYSARTDLVGLIDAENKTYSIRFNFVQENANVSGTIITVIILIK